VGFLSALAKIGGFGAKFLPIPGAGHIGDALSAAGSALGGAAEASAANRGSQLEAAALAEQLNQARQAQYVDQQLARSAEGRASGTNAWKKMQQAEYLANATGYMPAAGTPSYGFGPKAATATERDAATKFSGEAMTRINAGDSLLPQVVNPGRFQFDPKLLKASGFEKFANIASPVLTGIGAMAATNNDPLAALRAEHPELDEAQLRTIMAVLKQKGVRF
jgi:hypothetical protein